MTGNVNTNDFVRLALHAVGDPVEGRTWLQKTVYFLGVMTETVDQLGFRAHYYGPYSGLVASAMDRQRALGFVEQMEKSFSLQTRFERVRYDYRLTPDGEKVVEHLKERHSKLWKKLLEAAKCLKDAGEVDYDGLSIAAKTWFLLDRQGGKAKKSEIADAAKRIGWNVSPAQVNDAAEYLCKLSLVQT